MHTISGMNIYIPRPTDEKEEIFDASIDSPRNSSPSELFNIFSGSYHQEDAENDTCSEEQEELLPHAGIKKIAEVFKKDIIVKKDVVIKSFECPITLDKFQDPVVDECGHTFEREAILQIYQESVKKRVPFRCPLDRTKVLNVNKIVKNYNLASAQEEVKKEVKNLDDYHNFSQSKLFQALEENRRACEEFKKALKENERQIQISREINQQFSSTLRNFSSFIQEVDQSVTTSQNILNQQRTLKKKVEILKKENQNFKEANIWQRSVFLVYPTYAETISKRDITPLEEDILEQAEVNEEELSQQESDLDLLAQKIKDHKSLIKG